jgi:hypothetical protein
MSDYNGATHLINKMEELLSTKKLSTTAAVRLLLESQLHNIKARHDMAAQIESLRLETHREIELLKAKTQLEIQMLQSTSIGLKAYTYPKQALAVVILLISFLVSDIRQPVINWIAENIKILFSLL